MRALRQIQRPCANCFTGNDIHLVGSRELHPKARLDSQKHYSDTQPGTACPFDGSNSAPETCAELRGGRSRCSISQRAIMAQAFSSTH